MKRQIRVSLLIMLALCILLLSAVFTAGVWLTSPNQVSIKVPGKLNAEPVSFKSESGSLIHGSWIQGKEHMPGIILMHGVRANRTAVFTRAELFKKLGYSVLLFDFQGHGESTGKQITFGYLESRDAHEAVNFVKRKLPKAKIGVIGISMGGAASILGKNPVKIDALVLESVYPDIRSAIYNRIGMRIGFLAKMLTPLLLLNIRYILGINISDLCPKNAISNIHYPVLILSGTEDAHTTKEETQILFNAAPEPKNIDLFIGAKHVDLLNYDQAKYSKAVIDFFKTNLNH
jgi:alpha-beta hydrolase superfamily lysophospholipase